MPTYEYRCTSCGREAESSHRMGQAPDSYRCAALGCSGQMARRLSVPAVPPDGRYSYRAT